MHRTSLQRACATLFAIWFAFVGLEPGALGACPMHGNAAGAAMHANVSSHPAATGHGHADHEQAMASHDAPADDSAQHCACPDGCCFAVVALDLPTATPVVVRIAAFEPAGHAAPRTIHPAWTDFVLPFPTAPPLAPAT